MKSQFHAESRLLCEGFFTLAVDFHRAQAQGHGLGPRLPFSSQHLKSRWDPLTLLGLLFRKGYTFCQPTRILSLAVSLNSCMTVCVFVCVCETSILSLTFFILGDDQTYSKGCCRNELR